MGLILIAVFLAYAGTYAGKEIATEAAQNWGKLAAQVRKEGHPAAKFGVGIVAGLAWTARTGARGVRNAVRNDHQLLREAVTPEARAHRENTRRAKREHRANAKAQRAGAREHRRDRRRAEHEARQAPANTGQPPSGPSPTTQPPAAPATGTAPTIGDKVPSATGEANTFTEMISQLALLAGDGDKLVADTNVIAQAAERLDAAAVQFKLDPASRGALNRIGAACAQIAEAATQIRPQAQVATATVQKQQGTLHEAHQAQPNAAAEEFVKA